MSTAPLETSSLSDNVPFSYSEDPWIPAHSVQDVRIRLIRLEPSKQILNPRNRSYELPLSKEESATASELDALSCRIFWTPLNTATPFKALSYTWGTGALTQTIKANGKELFITESLEIALRHLRHSSKPVNIWADQICIDQHNDQEKTEQVMQMSRIYRAAEEVLVWLGPAADGSDSLMDIWKRVGGWAEDWGMMSYYTREKWSSLQRIIVKADPEDAKTIEFYDLVNRSLLLFNMQILEAMAAWHKRPWFTRVWVLQEFGLAAVPTFICGDKRITADQALLARQIFDVGIVDHVSQWPLSQEEELRAFALMQEYDPAQVFFATRQRRKARDADGGPGDTLYTLLQELFVENRMLATVHCDTVYGVLGIANDAEKLGIRADYTLKERTDLIYVRTTRAIIKQGDLDILALAQHPKLVDNLPSWVPDWTSSLQRSFAYGFRFFSASMDSPLELTDTPEEIVLSLKGFRVDEIEEVAGIWEGAEDHGKGYQHEAYIAYLAQIRRLCLLSETKNKDIYSSVSRRKEAVWRIPVGDIEKTELFDVTRSTHVSAEAHDMCLRNLEFFEQVKSLTKDELDVRREEWNRFQESGKLQRYRLSMRKMKNKRPFISKDGYVGLGPRYMRPGDHVVVFCGAMLPYVIRPVEEGSFRFLGECYCDGIMDGEIVRKRTKEEFFLV